MTTKEQLLDLICKFCIREGEFTLSSGETSNLYIDMKRVTNLPNGLLLVADQLLELMSPVIKAHSFTQVGGKAMGSIAITAAILTEGYHKGFKHLNSFYVREPKNHGTAKALEGFVDQIGDVVLVEDVVSTGASVMYCVNAIEEYFDTISALGWIGRLHGVYSIVNRAKDGYDPFKKYGIDFHYLFTIEELLAYRKSLRESINTKVNNN